MPQKITLAGLQHLTATMTAIATRPVHVGGAYAFK